MSVEQAANNPEFQRLIRLQTEAFARSTPYHSLELRDGTVLPGLIPADALRARLDQFPLPQDLTGKRVLDVGAASGWNSFECERRGAEVVAIDCVEYDELRAVKRLRESKVEYAIVDMEELTPERFGLFDYVLFFGVLYHLRHPLLGLENVCSVTRGVAFVESFVVDSEPDPSRCYLEFYETDELGGQVDNWCGPTTQCLMAMTRAAGFPRAEFLYGHSRRGGLIAHRRWEHVESQPGVAAPFLCSAVNNRHGDILFEPRKDEYAVLYFLSDEALTKNDLMVEIGEFGIPPLVVSKHDAGHWQVSVKIPPGVPAGDHDMRVGTRSGGFSETVRIRMLPAGADRRAGAPVFEAGDGHVERPHFSRVENTMDRSTTFRGYRNEALECRFTHSDGALDLSMVQLTIDGARWPLLAVERHSPEVWQVKARVQGLAAGTHVLRLRTRNSGFSDPVEIMATAEYDIL